MTAPARRRALAVLTWILAAHPDPRLRDTGQAVRLGEALCQRQGASVEEWRAAAAAYAGAGRWQEAQHAVQRAEALAAGGGAALQEAIQRQRNEVRNGQRPVEAALQVLLPDNDSLDSAPPVARLLLVWGARLKADQQLDAAIEVLRQATLADPGSAAAHRMLAAVLLDQQRLEPALLHLLAVVHLRPEDPALAQQVAWTLTRLGHADAAVEHYRQALRLAPEDQRLWYNLGLALVEAGRADEAIDHYRQALARWPESADLANNLAWLWATHPDSNLRDGPAAVERMQAVVAGNGDDPELLDTLAAAYAEAGRFADALETASRASQLAKHVGNEALAVEIAARLRVYQQRRAWRDMPLAARSDESSREPAAAARARGMWLAQQGRHDLAVWHFEAALRIEPDQEGHYLNLALALVACGKVEEAVACYRQAVERWPQSADLANNLAWLLATQARDGLRNGAEARRLAEPLCRRESPDPDHLDTLAAAYAECGQFAEALEACRRALALAEPLDDPELIRRLRRHEQLFAAGRPCRYWGSLPVDTLPEQPAGGAPRSAADEHRRAIVLMEAGQVHEAIAAFRRAVQLQPHSRSARINLALALLRGEQLDEALATLREALARWPDCPELANNLAWLLATHPDPHYRNAAEAIAAVEPFCGPDLLGDPELLDTLSAAYAEAGRFDEARQTARRALAITQGPRFAAIRQRLEAHLEEYEAGRPLRDRSLPARRR